MRWVRLFFRAFGWLLTPFMAWAASFFGCVAGEVLAARMHDPQQGLILSAICGAAAGFITLMLWLRLLRHSRAIRDVLAVTEDGTPDTASLTVPTTLDPEAPAGAPR